MIFNALTTFCTWRPRMGKNEYGDPIWAPSRDIKVRWENRERLIRTPTGEQVQSRARLFTAEEMRPGDQVVRGGITYTVLDVREASGLDGVPLWWEVYL